MDRGLTSRGSALLQLDGKTQESDLETAIC